VRGLSPVSKLAGLCLLAGVLLAGVLAPVVIGAGTVSNTVSDSVGAIPNQLVGVRMPMVTTVTDRNGAPLATLYDQYRLPVSYQQISPNMTSAIVAIEDRRFFAEQGVDLQSTMRAAVHDASGGSLQGASTITQQYVKNYLINVVDRGNPVAQQQDQSDTVARKLREAKMAAQVGQSLSKPAVLAGYLNVVEFTGNVYGIAAAAQAYFGTTPDKLTVPQSALLAGMVNNPNEYDPYTHPQQTLARRNTVLDAMVRNGALKPQQVTQARAQPLGVLPGGPQLPPGTCLAAAPDAGFFCQYVVRYLEKAGFTADDLLTGGYTIRTTMDPAVSQQVKNSVEANVPTTQNGVANALAVIAPGQQSHDVLAMVANRDYGTDASAGQTSTNLVSEVSNSFGAGSSFKIFTAAAALEQGKAGLDTPLPDPGSGCFPSSDPSGRGHCYPVQNDGGGYPNPISLQDALATSPNVAFVGLEQQVGVSAVVQMAERLGLHETLSSNDSGQTPDPSSTDPQYNQPQSRYFANFPSFTLGDSPVSPLEMTNVSATLMSGGVWCPPNPVMSVTSRSGRPVPVDAQPCQQVISPSVASTLRAGLSQDTTKGTSAKAAQAAGWSHPGIGKTGTTEQSESVAFVGGTDQKAVSSMVFADGSHPRELCPGPPVHLGSCGSGAFGGTVAAPPYFQAFNRILAGQADIPVPQPDPAYLTTGGHGPGVPYVVGQPLGAAGPAVTRAGYPVHTTTVGSALPAGQVIGESPQGTVPPGTPVELFVSNGITPRPNPVG
jgi:membrane peptidoglycan carboxypeptidase